MSPLKKDIILQKETVETVGLFGLCFIIPQLKLGVNSNLRRHRTVLTVSIITSWIQLLMLFLVDSLIKIETTLCCNIVIDYKSCYNESINPGSTS